MQVLSHPTLAAHIHVLRSSPWDQNTDPHCCLTTDRHDWSLIPSVKTDGIARNARLDAAVFDGGFEAQVLRVAMSLRNPSVIELQQPTQPFSALDCSFAAFFWCGLRKNKVVSDALMIPLKVVMSDILRKYMAKRLLTEENHSIQTFGFDR